MSTVTFWELRLKEVRGQLTPKLLVELWPDLVRRISHLRIEDVALRHWLEIAGMSWVNRDPAERILAATARQYGVAVLTVDGKFHHADSPVKAVW